MSETEEANDSQNEIAVIDNNSVNELIESGKLKKLLNAKKRTSYSLTSEYLSMEEGEVKRFAIVQKSTMRVDDDNPNNESGKKDVDCLVMVGDDSKTYTAAQTVLVNSVRQVPCLVEVECLGEVKMSGGRKYTDFNVYGLHD